MQIIERFAKQYNNMKVINKKNEGTFYCKLSGMREATGKYVGFVDSDDYIEPTMYEKLIQAAIKEDVDICECMPIPESVDKKSKKQVVQI